VNVKRERLVPKPPGEILAFEHPQLLKKLERKLGLTSEQAKELFLELMNFLLLCATTTGSHEPTPRVDEAWHEFILYTADYASLRFISASMTGFMSRLFRSSLTRRKRSIQSASFLTSHTMSPNAIAANAAARTSASVI
jgi:hypothetical protein